MVCALASDWHTHTLSHSISQYEHICCRYFLRVTIVKRLTDIVKEQDIVVHTLSQYPDMNNSIKMEVGIEDCLHIEFEYNKSKYVPTIITITTL